MKNIFGLVVLLLSTFMATADFLSSDTNWIKDVRSKLMSDYDKISRPVKNHERPTNVSFGIGLRQLHIDDLEQTLKMQAWLIVIWTDEFLTWNPQSYGGLEKVHFDIDEIWTPDLTVYNTAIESVSPFSPVPLLVSSEGKVMWVPPMQSVTSCSIDLTNWPSDQHKCGVSIGSWAHHGEQIDIELLKSDGPQISLDNYEVNPQWKLISSTWERQEIEYDGDKYLDVEITVELKRQSMTQLNFISICSLVVTVIILLSYLLPLKYYHGRVLLHALAIIITSINGTVLYSAMPTHNGAMPAVVRFYTGQLILCVLSLLSIVVIISCIPLSDDSKSSSSEYSVKLQGFIDKVPVIRRIVPRQETERHQYHSLDEETAEDSLPSHNMPSNDSRKDGMSYRTIARLINLIFFILFFISFIIDFIALRSYTKK